MPFTFPSVYESIIKEENINDGGYVQMEWNDTENTPLPIGTVCPIDSDYMLFSVYYPSQSSAYGYRYNVKFLHRLAQLDYLPFYFKTKAVTGIDNEGHVTDEDIELSTYPYMGNIQTIATALAESLTDHDELGTWTANTGNLSESVTASISFDGATIKSAAASIADAFGVDYWFDWSSHTIKFGSLDTGGASPTYGTVPSEQNGVTENAGALVSATDGGIQYNTFRILGGTKNMSKKTIRGKNVQVTQRLMLDNGSIMGGGSPKIMKDLVFDDIYPKMELWLYDVHERRCWLTDENGKKIIDSQEQDPVTGQTVTTYKKYSKWYFKLAHWNGTELVPYIFDTSLIIEGLPLSMVFQPNYEDNALPQPLVGREFELTYFSAAYPAVEKEDDDIDSNGYQPVHGEYRIIFTVDGGMILPSTNEEGIRPYGDTMSLRNNKVTLTNVAMDDVYKNAAKAELQAAGESAVEAYRRSKSCFTYVTYGNPPALGGNISSVRRNLITGEVQYTVGNYQSSKGLINRLSDKIESIGSNGGKATTEDENKRGRSGGISELSIPLLSCLMGSGNVVKDTLTILNRLLFGTEGHGVEIDQNGNASMTIGSLTVLGTTQLNEIDVNHIKHTGGLMVVTKANIIVDHVERLDGGIDKLYFRRVDGSGQVIYNQFEVGDLALMMTFNQKLDGSINRYFWREVSAIDDGTGEFGFITLLPSSPLHSVPQKGDVVVQLGNTSDVTRQGVSVLGGSGPFGGFFAVYDGFNTWQSAAPSLNDYNNALIYLSPKKNKITGNFISIAGVNLQERLEAIRGDLLSIRQQSDRQLVIWYGDDDDPLPNSGDTEHWNTPAKDWHDADVLAENTEQQQLHVDDIFYLRRNNTTRVGGKAWQWTYDAILALYLWVEIDDADTIAALEAADDAVATANDALEKVENLADDGVISGKAEKSDLLIAWQDTVAEYVKLIKQAEDYSMENSQNTFHSEYDDYDSAYNLLAIMLNGFSDSGINSIKSGNALPAWLSSLNIDTKLEDYAKNGGIMGIDGTRKDTLEKVKEEYRARWKAYFDSRSALLKAIEEAAKAETDRAHGRIDNIVSDGIISAGSEKSLLYIDWMKAVAEYKKYMEQAEDYFGASNTQDDALVAAYTNLAKMLNNGTNPTANILNGTDRPSWLTAANMNTDTVLANTPTQNASNYHSVWNSYQVALTALLEVITKKAKELADAAQEDASLALSKISDMGSDGKLVSDEKLTVKREFLASWHERDDAGGILDRCMDGNQYISNAIQAAYTKYNNAFKAVGSFLNGRTNGSPTEWTGITITITSQTTDAQIENAMPLWLKSANMGGTNTIDGDDWRDVWATFYSARTALLTALSEDAKNRADDALDEANTANGRLNDMADDSKLDPAEKVIVRREFVAAWRERDAQKGLIDRCYVNNQPINDTIVNSYLNPYKAAFLAVANYLNGSNNNWTDTVYPVVNIDDYIPLWLHIARKDTTESINGETWRSLWSAFYTARTALLTALSDDAKNRADNAQVTADEKKRVFQTNNNELPPAPYEVGDLWVNAVWNSSGGSWSANDPTYSGDTLICVHGRAETVTDQRSISDWADAVTGVTAKIANLGNMIDLEVQNRKSGTSSMLRLDESSGSLALSVYNAATDSWSTLTSIGLALEKQNGVFTGKLNLLASNTVINSDLISVIASNINIQADQLDFAGGSLKIDAENIDFTGSNYTIDASNINFAGVNFSINASNINFTTVGTRLNLQDGVVRLMMDNLGGVTGHLAPTGLEYTSGDWKASPLNPTQSYPHVWVREMVYENRTHISTTYILIKKPTDSGKGYSAQFASSSTPTQTQIHNEFVTGDYYMRLKKDGDANWGEWFLVVGENYDENGNAKRYNFNRSTEDTLPNETQALQEQLGMVVMKEGEGVGEFSFGTYINGVFNHGLRFRTDSSGTSKLVLAADTTIVNGDFKVSAADNIDFAGKTITLSASDTLTFATSGSGRGTINFEGVHIIMNAEDIDTSSLTFTVTADQVRLNAGSSLTLTDGLVSLLLNQVGSGTNKEDIQKSLGMVIRKEGTVNDTYTFAFGSFVNGNFVAGLQFKEETISGVTTRKLLLSADTTEVNSDFKVSAGNIDFEGKTITIAANKSLTFVCQGTGTSQGIIDFRGAKVQINSNDIDIQSASLVVDVSQVTFNVGGTTGYLSDGLVSLFMNQLDSNNTPSFQQQLGMVIRRSGTNNEFSFGSYVNGTFKAGLQFKLVNNNQTKLMLTSNNVEISTDLFTLISSQITVSASNLDIDAEQINFQTGGFKVGPENQPYFSIDSNGRVTLRDLTVLGNSTFHGDVSGTILPTVDLYHNVCMVVGSGNNNVGNADIVIIGGHGINTAAEDIIITLPNPDGCHYKVVTIYGAQKPASLRTNNVTIRLAVSGSSLDIRTPWGTTCIDDQSNNLRDMNEMVLMSQYISAQGYTPAWKWCVFKYTVTETTNGNTYVKDNLSGSN